MVAVLCVVAGYQSNAQEKYLIIDRKLKQPIQISDTITNEQMNKGLFAVERRNADSLISKLRFFRSKLRQVGRYYFDETNFNIGSTKLTVKVMTYPFGDRLNVSLSTDVGSGHDKEFYISDAKLTNNDNARYLNKLIRYINTAK